MTGRWAPLVVASLVAALLATGAGVGADQVVERGAGASQPRLRTVPASTLDRLGLTLSSVAQPPYCDLTDQGSGARVLESLLARVTSQRVRAIGRNRETWLVVVQGQPGSQFRYWPCPLQVGGSTACPMGRLASSRLVLVDASSGAVAGSLNLGPVSGQRPSSRGAGGNGRYLGPGASLAQS
jgi:hypothetical protein